MPHVPSTQPLILVIDGSQTRLKVLDIELRRQGYQVRATRDPVQLYRDLFAPTSTCTPALLLVGDHLSISGLEIVRAVRRRVRYHTLPIIKLGPRHLTHLLFAKLAGATDYLDTPFTIADLRALIARHAPLPQIPEQS